jgi:uncharacterized protein YejL (UPF0352 family)
MNIALRKLAMLEKSIAEKEESAIIQGDYVTNVVNEDLKRSITVLMDKVRALA